MSSNPYVTKVELGVELDKQNQKIDLKVNNLELGVNGSIDTTTYTVSLPDGVYRAQISGTYTNASNIVVKEGYYTLLRKKDDGSWVLESEVKMPVNPADGVVEEGNTQAVSGGEVFNKIKDVPNISKSLDFFLKDYSQLNFITGQWFDNAFFTTSLRQYPAEGYANGFFYLSDLPSNATHLKIEGGLNNGGSGILFVAGINESEDIYDQILVGASNIDSFDLEIDNKYEYYFFSVAKSQTKIYSVTKEQAEIQTDAVKKYIDEEIKDNKELNFKDFGAKCDGVTNDTSAFLNAFAYLVENGGGKIRLSGTMLINQTQIPYNHWDNFCTIQIVGDYVPTGTQGSVGEIPLNTHNSTILCNDTNFIPGRGVIWTVKGPEVYDFNYITLVIENVVIRTNESKIGGLILSNFQQAIIRNVNIDTGIYAGQVSEPTNQNFALAMPGRNNGAICIAENVYISGYYYGFIAQEHCYANNIFINCCKTALAIGGAGHPLLIGRIIIQKCHRVAEILFQSTFEIQQLAVEKASSENITPGKEWTLPDTYDIYDLENLGRGNITYSATIPGLTFNNTLSKSGGNDIKMKKIGEVTFS